MSNLPSWRGASETYSKAYRVLDQMAADGHVSIRFWCGKITCSPSQDMEDLIDALNKGNEEKIKGLLMLARDRGYKPEKNMKDRERKSACIWMKRALLYDHASYDDCGEIDCTKLAENCADGLELYEDEECNISQELFDLAVDVEAWYNVKKVKL